MGHGTPRWFDADVTTTSQRATLVAGLSLGIFLFGLESDRLAALARIQGFSSMPVLTSLISIAILGVGVALICKRPPNRPAPLAIPILAALACSLGLAGIYLPMEAQLPETVEAARRVLYAVSSPSLIYFWAQRVMPLGRPLVIRSFGVGAITVGCLGMLTVAFEHAIALGLVFVLPVVGVALLPAIDGSKQRKDDTSPAGNETSRWSALRTIARGYSSTGQATDGESLAANGRNRNGRTREPLSAHEATDTGTGAMGVKTILMPLLKLAPFLCYTVIFGNVHFSWVALQDDGTVSTWVQLGASVGSIICGCASFALARLHWGRALGSIMSLLLIAFALLALWLSSILASGYVFAYLVLLNIAQKLTFLLMMLFGFPYARDGHECASLWALAYFSFFLGTCVSHVSSTFYATDMLNVIASIALVAVFAADIADVILLYGNVSSNPLRVMTADGPHNPADAPSDAKWNPQGSSSAGNGTTSTPPVSSVSSDANAIPGIAQAEHPSGSAEAPSAPPSSADPGLSGFDNLAYTCHLIAGQHNLTRREEEILQLLARGRTAARISEALCITVATARTHQRNIYNKLGVHSQQDILDLFDERHPEGQAEQR